MQQILVQDVLGLAFLAVVDEAGAVLKAEFAVLLVVCDGGCN